MSKFMDYLNSLAIGGKIINESLDGWYTEDGWNGEQIYQDTGLDEFFEKVETLRYEIESARRGSHALDGDKSDDLIKYVINLQQDLESIVENLPDTDVD